LKKVGEFQNWFEVYEVHEGTFAIYEPYQFQEVISYLVLGEERAALIDTGNGIGNIKEVATELTDLPISVLLTHEHLDHYAGAHLFEDVAMYNNAQAIEVVRAGVPHERAVRAIDTESKYVWKPLPEGVDPATWHIPGAEPTSLFEDGDIIDLGGRKLEVIFTPGHSAGSACFLDADNRLLFTGDHFYPGPLYAHGSGVDLERYLASNDKIADRVAEYDYVVTAHNEPLVEAEVIPRVSEAFRTIFDGGGDYSEDGALRRYKFDGFDILVRAEAIQ
jgi:glyoxylase-like metal-dependent hydrolase (beta-lactamase superfamily II)